MLNLAVTILVAVSLGYVLELTLHSWFAYLLAALLGAPAAIGLFLMIGSISGETGQTSSIGAWELRGMLLVGSLGGVAGVFMRQMLREK